MRVDREFQFRGDRKYLQSASLFDDLIALRGGVTDIDFKFHHKSGHQVAYVDELPSDQALVAEWRDSKGAVYVVERPEPILRATPYDEPVLVAKFRIEGRNAFIPADVAPFTTIEALVAGFKRLLQAVYPDISRKYVFVRIRLRQLPEGPVVLRYSRDIGSFFQGDIAVDGKPVGQIFFGEWQ
jgi:hypothetical protein